MYQGPTTQEPWITLKVGLDGEEVCFLVGTGASRSTLNFIPKGGKLSKRSLVIQGVSGKDEQVYFIQPLLVDVGDRFEMH